MFLRYLLCLSAALLLSACILPSDFHAELTLLPDGGYRFALKGEVLYLPALAERASPHPDRAQLAAYDRAFLSELKEVEGLRVLGPADGGAYRVALEERGRFGHSAWLPRSLPIIKVERRKEGIGLLTEPFDPSLERELRRLGIAAAGEVCVTLVDAERGDSRACQALRLDRLTAQRIDFALPQRPLVAAQGRSQ